MPESVIAVDGRELTYFPNGEQIGALAPPIVGLDRLEDRHLWLHPRLRRVLTTFLRPTPKFYGVLHWSDGKDLVQLDERVREGDVTDNDFAGAVLAEPRTIICTSCEAGIRALVVDTGQVLFARSLAGRLRSHRFETACPACSAALMMPIVEFIGE